MRPNVLTPYKLTYTEKRPACMFLKNGCERCAIRSTWRVSLLLKDKHGVEKRQTTQLKVCNRHRAQLKLDHVLDPPTWQHVTRQMLIKGYRPKRSRTKLEFDYLNELVDP